jgi:hypothetical protein
MRMGKYCVMNLEERKAPNSSVSMGRPRLMSRFFIVTEKEEMIISRVSISTMPMEFSFIRMKLWGAAEGQAELTFLIKVENTAVEDQMRVTSEMMVSVPRESKIC